MSNEIVRPVIKDGVEFYCSTDGRQTGISQSGCARLCGVDERQIRRILTELQAVGRSAEKPDSDENNKVSETVKNAVTYVAQQFEGVRLYLDITSAQQAKILDSKVVALLVTYFAFEKNMEVARYSLGKFASIGVNKWIQDVTGFQSDNSQLLLESINQTMGKLLIKVERLEAIEEETLGYRKATVTMPVLEKWMLEVNELEKAKILEPSEELYTIKECVELIYPNCTISSTILKKLALKVSQTINALSDKPVSKKDTPNGKGFKMRVNGYTAAQIPLIRLCLQSIMSEF
ncbi:MAG: hypothetical protein ACRDBG_16070 [Waterburya sp.]